MQKFKLVWLIVLLIIITSLVVSIWQVGWGWTGLTSYESITKSEVKGTETIETETHPAKTLWDFLELALIPAGLAVVALWFSRAQSHTEQTIALNQQEEALLQSYIDAMTALILEKHLRETNESNAQDIDVRNIARSRTLTVLRALITPNPDGKNRRRGSLIRFLYETQLIKGEAPIVSLKKANLEVAYMRLFDLQSVNFQETSLYRADLRGSNLQGANLQGTYLREADLRGANLIGARLKGADLKGCIYGSYKNLPTRWPDDFEPVGTGAIRRDHR